MSSSQAPVADPPPGYQLLDEVGHGGMGVVWRAHDLSLNREVAIKFLKPERASDVAAAERFLTESRITGQLQHPGIPAVHELGTLPDGRPFLAMKLVRGRTLQELLKANPAERGRFIAIFEQVCHAVGYAHAHKVIHRDLKPANVMVGEFGEVQVMDWGLAKVLVPSRDRQGAVTDAAKDRAHGQESRAAGVEGREHRPGDQELATDERTTETWVPVHGVPEQGDRGTQTGSVLGTVSYMPPEQARGEIYKLDARSDVFGLGATLCHILTGRPPYCGKDSEEVRLQAVRWEVAEAFAALDSCGAEPDLIALCKRCLAREQADRPRDGRAVAAEVGRIRQAAEERARQAELEQQRAWVREAEQRKRRRQAIVAGSITAAVLLAGLAVSLWQMLRAVSAEQQVRQERDAKDEALKAERIARQAEKEARDQAMAALRVMTDEVVERQLARSPTLTEENKEFLRKVIKHFEGFAAITANDADSRAIRAEGYAGVGLMRDRLGDFRGAEAAYREALARYQGLVAECPTRADYRQELATGHNNLGNLLTATGRLAEAEAAYRTAVELQRELVAAHPRHLAFRQGLAGSLTNLGILLRATSRLAEAEAAYREALALRKRLVAEAPAELEYRQELAASHNNLGVLLHYSGRPEEAERELRQALALRKILVAELPTRPDLLQELANSYTNLGTVLHATGRLNEAEDSWREALVSWGRLAAEFPARPAYRQGLAASHNNLAILFSHSGRLADAEAAYRDALALRTRLAADFPTHADYQHDAAGTFLNLAILCIKRQNFPQAKSYLDQAQPYHGKALAANPASPLFRQSYRNSLFTRARTLAGLLDQSGAVQTAERIRDLGWNPAEDAYDAACAMAQCAALAAAHPQLETSQRQQAGAFYGDQALQLLRTALHKGFHDANVIKTDPDLAPLRDRDDFQKLLADLETKPQPPAKDPQPR